jgi:hypothetical protein
MSRPIRHSFVFTSAALLASSLGASAQFVDLLTEAPVTLQVTQQSSSVTTTATSRATTFATSKLTNALVLQELLAAGIIPDASITGWSLVAVRSAPSDLDFVDASFMLYAIKGTTRIAVPTGKFLAAGQSTAAAYVEKNQGRYILSSKGTVTNHLVCQYNPTFTVGTNTYALDSSEINGIAKIKYATLDLTKDYEIFFYAISSVSAVITGGYTGTLTSNGGNPMTSTGLSTLTITVGAPKLVPATFYPGVDTFWPTNWPWLTNWPTNGHFR